MPGNPFIRSAYRWYSRHVLPTIGRLLSRNTEAYGYLPASIEAFATPEELMSLLRKSGFVGVTASPLTFGVVCLYTARRK
jgi:demethylmenaquinone methyltransferase/2-methoxy-6-polyprenyl-1,4-benzoquinol methylase